MTIDEDVGKAHQGADGQGLGVHVDGLLVLSGLEVLVAGGLDVLRIRPSQRNGGPNDNRDAIFVKRTAAWCTGSTQPGQLMSK